MRTPSCPAVMPVSTPPIAADRMIALDDVSVRYLLLPEEQRTLKGRLLSLVSRRHGSSADFWALRNVSLSFHRGEIVGIVGGNGSGKSTLLRVMSRIIEPAMGSVEVNGMVSPILDLGGVFNGELTGRENAYLYGSVFRLSRPEMDERIPDLLAFSELSFFFDAPVKTYSSGMSARLAFALATLAKPEMLLIDEVLAVGDENFSRKSYARMRKLMSQGSLVVVVSHNLVLLEQICSRVIYLKAGTVMFDGNPKQALTAYKKAVTG